MTNRKRASTIVFEVAGQLKDFYAQAQALGLEYLGDYEEEFAPSEDFYDKKKPEKAISWRIYLAMPDVRALQELLGLWRRYQRGENMPSGKSEWRELFSLLDRCEALGSAGPGAARNHRLLAMLDGDQLRCSPRCCP